MLALRSQIFEDLRETFYGHALEYLQSPRSGKNKENKKGFLLRKPLTIIDHFEGLWSVGVPFRCYRQSQVLNKKQSP